MKKRDFTVNVFFNDGTHLNIDCDDFVAVEGSHYYAVSDDIIVMNTPFKSVKYVTVDANNTETG